jgi:thymidylate kinase
MNAPRTSVFISLEGLSGVGKTETAELLASTNACEFIHLTTDYASTKELMIRAEDVDARFCLFISAMLHKSVRIQDRLNQGITSISSKARPSIEVGLVQYQEGENK